MAEKPKDTLAELAQRLEAVMRGKVAPPRAEPDTETVLSNTELSRYGYRRPPDDSVATEKNEQSSEKASVAEKPTKPDFWTYADKAMFGLCEFLALLFGLPFGEDLYHDKPIASIGGWHWLYFGIAALFAVTGPMWPWIRTRTWLPATVIASLSRVPLDARLWIGVLLLLFLYGTAPEIYQRATAPAASSTPFNKNTSRRSAEVPTNLGPFKLLAIKKYLDQVSDKWVLFITYAPENLKYRSLLQALLMNHAWIFDAPDTSADLDAPKFPLPPTDAGFTLHGRNILTEQLAQLFGPCFIIHRTDREIDGLADWFNRRLSEAEHNENRKIVWIEIGHGSPWRVTGQLDECFQ